MLILRRIIFYLFLLIYIVLCPALLLYASGYIIDPLTREVERTGLIHLTSIPSGANIYLERSRFLQKTPATIDKLRPGDYRVTLDLPGYRTWTQAVPVKAGKAVAFDKVLLIPRSFSPQTPLPGAFKHIYPLIGTDYLFVAEDAGLGSARIFNIRGDKAVPIVLPNSPFYNFSVITVFHEESSRIMVLYGGGLWERKYLLVNFKGDIPLVSDITRLFSKDPLLIKWDPSNPNELYAVYANYIDRLDVSASAVFPKDIEDIKGCGFQNGRTYLVTGDNHFIKYGRDKTKPEIFLEGGCLDPSLLDKNVFYHIAAPEDNLAFLVGEQGSLLSNYPPYQILKKGVVGEKYYEHRKRLMFWTSTVIAATELEEDKVSGMKKIVTKKLFMGGQDIKQCFWAFNGSYVVCNDNDKIYLIEIEPEGVEHSEFIAAVKKAAPILYSDDVGAVYFLDEAGKFQKIQLVPRENLVQQFLIKEQ